MFKKIYLVGAAVFMLIFGMTVGTTITNPIGSNLAISGVLLVISIGSFLLHLKVNKETEEATEKVNDFTPVVE